MKQEKKAGYVAIMGTPIDSGNRGVLALGASLVDLCSAGPTGRDAILLLGNKDNQPVSIWVRGQLKSIPVVNCRMSPFSRPSDHFFWILLMSICYRLLPVKLVRSAIAATTPWIRAVADAEFVGEMHGGDSFSDIYGLKGLVLTFFMDWTVLLVRGSMVQFPQTYGPFKSRMARILARFILRRSSVIIARDRASQEVAQSLVRSGTLVELSPDVAFSLESVHPGTISATPPLSGPIGADVIGINVNGLMYNGGYNRRNMFGLRLDYVGYLAGVVARLLTECTGEILFVPHTFAPLGDVESDQEACRKVIETVPVKLRSRVRMINREYDQNEIKGVIGACDFFIGSRMHACIAGLSQGVPCVGVAYSMKFEGVFESVGMEGWVIDGRTMSSDDAIIKTIELYRRRESVRSELKVAGVEARRRLSNLFTGLQRPVCSGAA